MNSKIAIFWGAFNPPTNGHFHVIEKILKNTDIEKVIITPDGLRLDKNYWIEEKHRKKMIQIFINELIEKWFNIEIDNHFLENKNNWDTTTVKVDLYFKEKLWLSPWHIFWTDISNEIKNWTWNPNKYIEKELKKIFIKRPWYDFNNLNFENFILINPEKKLDISSTIVRKNKNLNIPISNLVIKEIEEYIIKNNLYI